MPAEHEEGWVHFVAALDGGVNSVLCRYQEHVPLSLGTVQRGGDPGLHDPAHSLHIRVGLAVICGYGDVFDIWPGCDMRI